MQRLQTLANTGNGVHCRRTLTSSWVVLVVKSCKHSLPLEAKIEEDVKCVLYVCVCMGECVCACVCVRDTIIDALLSEKLSSIVFLHLQNP